MIYTRMSGANLRAALGEMDYLVLRGQPSGWRGEDGDGEEEKFY